MSEWYYAKGGKQSGPVSLETLQEMIRTGQIDPVKDLVWSQHLKDWKPASQVGELHEFKPESSLRGLIQASQHPNTDPSRPPAATAPGSGIDGGNHPIGIIACIQRGFELTKDNFVNILLVMLILIGVQMLIGIVIQLVGTIILASVGIAVGATASQQADTAPAAAPILMIVTAGVGLLVIYLITQALSIYLQLGLIRFGLNLVDGAQVEVGQVFGEGRKLLRAFGATILYGIAVMIGMILLIIPGIFIAMRCSQYMTAIVDRNMGIMESLSYSYQITRNNFWRLIGLSILGALVAVSGILLCGVGMIFTAPVAMLSWMVAYRWMQGGSGCVTPHR